MAFSECRLIDQNHVFLQFHALQTGPSVNLRKAKGKDQKLIPGMVRPWICGRRNETVPTVRWEDTVSGDPVVRGFWETRTPGAILKQVQYFGRFPICDHGIRFMILSSEVEVRCRKSLESVSRPGSEVYNPANYIPNLTRESACFSSPIYCTKIDRQADLSETDVK